MAICHWRKGFSRNHESDWPSAPDAAGQKQSELAEDSKRTCVHDGFHVLSGSHSTRHRSLVETLEKSPRRWALLTADGALETFSFS